MVVSGGMRIWWYDANGGGVGIGKGGLVEGLGGSGKIDRNGRQMDDHQ